MHEVRTLAESQNVGEAAIPESVDVWQNIGHSLFNTKEFLYVK
jgi:hypothetical protein